METILEEHLTPLFTVLRKQNLVRRNDSRNWAIARTLSYGKPKIFVGKKKRTVPVGLLVRKRCRLCERFNVVLSQKLT